MLFKNLRLYRLTKPFSLGAEELHKHLVRNTFRPCGSLELFSYGWTAPLGRHGSELVHTANGYLMICARRDEKILPAAVIRDLVSDKAAQIEDAEGRKPGRKERETMRDEVMQDLLPRALSRTSRTFAYIAPQDGWLVVDAASPKKAEDLTSLLRDSLGSLPLTLPTVQQAPAAVMTRWLDGSRLPADFALADECELRDPGEEGCVARCKKQDLGADEVQAHLQAGKQAAKLAVHWNGRLSCLLTEDLAIKRLRFEDVVQEEFGDVDGADEAARFDAEFAMMTLELARFMPRLLEAFGGEDEQS